MIKLLIVDDHELVRDGIRALVADERDMEVAGIAGSGEQAVELCETHHFDVVMMDMNMPGMNGVQTTNEIRAVRPTAKVLMVTINEEGRYIKEALKAGASGYILKHSRRDEILAAIRSVASGKPYYSGEVLARISDEFSKGSSYRSTPMLTGKEKEVLQLIALEFSNQEIAEHLQCSMRTVDTHKRNIIKKLGVRNIVGLVKYAMKMGIVTN